jgi:hypothetical protein
MADLFSRYVAATPPGVKVEAEAQPTTVTPVAPKTGQTESPSVKPIVGEIAGETGVLSGDLGHKFRVTSNLNNKAGIPISGRIVNNKETPDLFNIEINDANYGENAAKLTEPELNFHAQNKRKLHLMKFILDKNLDRNISVDPTAEEQDEAIQMFDTYGSGNASRITKAYTLVSRAFSEKPKSKEDISSLLLLNTAFERTGQSLNSYVTSGETVNRNDPLPGPTEGERIKAQRNKDMLTFSTKTPSPASKYVSKYESRIAEIDRRIGHLVKQRAGLRGDNPEVKKINSEIDNLNSDRTSFVSQEDQNFRVWKDEQEAIAKQQTDFTSRIASYNATISNIDEADKTELIFQDFFNKHIEGWVGIHENDDTKFNGWISQGVAEFYKIAPTFPTATDKRGGVRNSTMLPGDFVNWVQKNGKYRYFKNKVAAMPNPKPEALNEIIQLTSDADKLISPLQELFFKFDQLQKGWTMDNTIKKFFSEEYAAEENNVFHIMAARRKFVTGGGNPSNYEQEMLLSGIPNPGKVFSFAGLNKERIRTIAYLTMLDHARTMQRANFKITASALKHYNMRYSKILGYQITAADINRHMTVIDTYGLGSKDVGYQSGTASSERAKSYFDKFHDLLMAEEMQRNATK